MDKIQERTSPVEDTYNKFTIEPRSGYTPKYVGSLVGEEYSPPESIYRCGWNICSNTTQMGVDFCPSHVDKPIRNEHIRGKCPQISWKKTKRVHVCNGDLYKHGICYYHYSKSYLHEKKTGPNSRGRKGGNRW